MRKHSNLQPFNTHREKKHLSIDTSPIKTKITQQYLPRYRHKLSMPKT